MKIKKIILFATLPTFVGINSFLSVLPLTSCQKNTSDLSYIELDDSAVKKQYGLGYELTTEWLLVTAHFADGSSRLVTDYQTEPKVGTKLTSKNTEVIVSYEYNGITKKASYPIRVDDSFKLTCIVANEDSDINIVWPADTESDKKDIETLLYSKDGDTWFPFGTTEKIQLKKGDFIYLSGLANVFQEVDRPTQYGLFNSLSNHWHFEITGDVALVGDLLSLVRMPEEYATLYQHGLHSSYCFAQLFKNSTGITSISSSLFTNIYDNNGYAGHLALTESCFESMFEGCTNLTDIGVLPRAKLASKCYKNMFKDCTSLSVLPDDLFSNNLQFKSAANDCLMGMFKGCSALTSTPILNLYRDPTAQLQLPNGMFDSMFAECTALTRINNLRLDLINDEYFKISKYCFASMFEGCTNLINLPQNLLQSRDLTDADGCYYQMFYNCVKLRETPVFNATKLSKECYYGMFAGCESLTNTNDLAFNAFDDNCDSCYEYMFYNCPKIMSYPTIANNGQINVKDGTSSSVKHNWFAFMFACNNDFDERDYIRKICKYNASESSYAPKIIINTQISDDKKWLLRNSGFQDMFTYVYSGYRSTEIVTVEANNKYCFYGE